MDNGMTLEVCFGHFGIKFLLRKRLQVERRKVRGKRGNAPTSLGERMEQELIQ